MTATPPITPPGAPAPPPPAPPAVSPLAGLAAFGTATEAEKARKQRERQQAFVGFAAALEADGHDPAQFIAWATDQGVGEMDIPNREAQIAFILEEKANGTKRDEVIKQVARRTRHSEDLAEVIVNGVWEGKILPAGETPGTGGADTPISGTVIDTGVDYRLILPTGSTQLEVHVKEGDGWAVGSITVIPTVEEYRTAKDGIPKKEKQGKSPEQLVDIAVNNIRRGVTNETGGALSRVWSVISD